ncbi:MAG TPA: hypothetical protein VHX68_09570 [Planctomycetaceae bacterium]|nr:hypothetical protein [Planctomycetaceae bacterium]
MCFVIFAIAAGIFVATGDFLLGSLLPYVWAAWPSVESAFWLRKKDPVRERGKTCFWFYLSAGSWRAALSAFLIVVVFAVIEGTAGIPPNMDDFARTMVVLLVGISLSSLFGIFGTAGALRRRIRVWVTPGLKKICHGDFDALAGATEAGRFNYTFIVLMTSVFVPILTVGGLMAMLGATGKGPNAPHSTVESAGLGVLLLGPIAAVPGYVYLATRIDAKSARDCWPDVFRRRNRPS